MKTTNKFLLTATALAVLTSTSAFASKGIDLIKTDDITVNLDGDLDLKIYNTGSADSDHPTTVIESNWDDFDASFAYKIDDHLTFLAGTDWTVEPEMASQINNQGNYMGFSYDNNKLMAGGQEISFDTFGIDNSEVAPADNGSGYHDANSTWHNSAIVYRYSFDDAYISATYAKGNGTDSNDTQKSSPYDVSQVVGFANVGDFELMSGIGQTKAVAETVSAGGIAGYKAIYGQLEAVYNYGNGKIGINLAMEDDQDAFTSQGVDLDFSYNLTKKATLALGTSYITQDFDDNTDSDDFMSAYAAVIYKFNSYVILHAEVGQQDGQLANYGTTGADSDTATGNWKTNADHETTTALYLNFQY